MKLTRWINAVFKVLLPHQVLLLSLPHLTDSARTRKFLIDNVVRG